MTAWRCVAGLGVVVLLSVAMSRARAQPGGGSTGPSDSAGWRITGVVWDSASGAAVVGALVALMRDQQLVGQTQSDSVGRYLLRAAAPGSYTVSARSLGYGSATRPIALGPAARAAQVDFRLAPVATTIATVTTTGEAPVAVDTRTGDQTFQQGDYHGAPTTTPSQIIQQSIAGAARAPTGEVHIHGQHAEYTYYVDGVPVPASIGGTLNELFDPAIIGQIDFQTGSWDAEYGNKNIAIVNVETKVPAGGFHYEASAYDGSYNSDGQSLLMSTNSGPFGVLVSVTRQETSMRREPLEAALKGDPLNFHNAGQDQTGFTKVIYTPSSRDVVTLDLNASRTHSQIPYDSSFGPEDDNQTDENGFANLGWRHRFGDHQAGTARSGAAAGPELFTAAYMRRSTLNYVPGAIDEPQFIFYPDTADRYNVQENRAATTTGVKADYTLPVSSLLTFKTGVDASLVEGREDFNTVDSLQRAGPSVNTGLRGGDAAIYAETVLDPSVHWELRTGLRLDHHVAPVAGDAHQVSPRVRLNWFPDHATTVWWYYGRLFIPSNVEDFHVLGAAANGGMPGMPTVPERDNYYETGVVHRFSGGVATKFDGFYRDDSPAIDDNTLPGTALDATVNIHVVHVTGIESVLEVHPGGPFSGYFNAALSHASAHGPVTGGFFPTPYPSGWFDQDHDQRLSLVGNFEYAPRWGYVSLTSIFGSGLTNGDPEGAPNYTSLFAFNPGVKVAPSTIYDPSIGTHFQWHGMVVQPQLFADNVLNRKYVLKGAFTSGPSIGRPRSVELRVSVSH